VRGARSARISLSENESGESGNSAHHYHSRYPQWIVFVRYCVTLYLLANSIVAIGHRAHAIL